MSTRIIVKKNMYFDSVPLIPISTCANKFDGVEQAFVAMATEMNKGVLKNLGLLTPELEETKSGDLTIVIRGTSETANDQTLMATDDLFTHKEQGGQHESCYAMLANARKHVPESSLAATLVSGLLAACEARQVLQNNLNVMLFSDNVSLEDELALKQLAHGKGPLMMGSDCGTATVNSVVLRFGSAVRRGNIGIIGASGIGSQELSVRIHEFGGGISQLTGADGRDLSEKIGGLTMLDVTGMLEVDPQTEIIVFISKPPVPAVAHKVSERVRACHKSAVVCFFGREAAPADGKGLQFVRGTKEAVLKAILLTGMKKESLDLYPFNWSLIEEARARLTPQQKYIYGLFCGGTLCDEAMFAAMEKYAEAYSNTHPDPALHLKDLNRSVAHILLDPGDGNFVNGKPHPMTGLINHISRLLQEACDPEVGVIVMDFVLGFGSHEDPVDVMLDAIAGAKVIVAADGRPLEVLGYVLGTDLDAPSLEKQRQMLTDTGAIWASSSTNTGLLVREFICKGEKA